METDGVSLETTVRRVTHWQLHRLRFVDATLAKRFLDDFFRLFNAVEDTGVDVEDGEDRLVEVHDAEMEMEAGTLARDVRTPNEAPTEMTPMTTSGL
ncbi:unnamed protein product [Peronospora destructor]|uniref:Uncharacterized protein n=1 Tax=Peronospora destructor TaxID=86335 RepID=A0AAV0TAY9_9STRA|nr:unnamed protein product [Peronospora destructor]